ncbi:hypothetical protein [Galbibacter sp.]|uniref:hypothetical protein n=1 Tax=Galbibacter sp. TaxID=2918471 RepID=UPI003A907CD8
MTNTIQLLKSRLTLYFSAFIILIFTACDNGDDHNIKTLNTASGYSMIIADNTPIISGYGSQHNEFTSRFWIDTESVEENSFESIVNNQTLYRKAIDENFRINYVYKDSQGQNQYYQFDQGSLAETGRVFYYKNDFLTFMNNDSIGTVTTVGFYNDQPYFAGSFGEVSSQEAGNSFYPTIPFIWDGNDLITTLPLPDQTKNFQGINTIYVESTETTYVGGLCGIPMYWKNTTPVILDQRYGEVWQVTKSDEDIYAVGLINKHNSNSTGHTACYWKNGELHELEDNAQAYGIFIDGDDVYVSGAFGATPIDYKPCYWKNGVRVELSL